MRIAFLITEFPTVAQTFVVEKIESLLDHGHDVTVFTWESNPPSILHETYRRIDWERRTIVLGRVDHWSLAGKLARLAGRLGAAMLRSPGEAIDLVRRIARGEGGRKEKFRRLIHALPFCGRGLDLLHIQFAWGGLGVETLGEDLGLPVVLSLYGADVTVAPPGENDRLYAASDLILPDSGYLAGLVLDRGVPEEKVAVHYNPIDCERFTPLPDSDRAPMNPVPNVLTVARMHWKKALLDGLAALAILRDRGMEIRYHLIGEGSDRPALEAAIADYGLADRVHLLGTRDRDGIRDAMREADVFFLPSVREEFGCVLGEAQACGTPCVATTTGGIPEVVEDDVTGFLARPRNPSELADKLAAMLARPDRGRSMGRAGRERVERLFSRRRLELDLIAHYRSLLGPRPAATPVASRRPTPTGAA